MSFIAGAAAATAFALIVFWILFKTDHRLPPGPSRLPLLGHLHLLGTLPHKSLSDLSKKYGAVMLLWFGSIPTVVVSSASAAREFLCTHDLDFASRPTLSFIKYLFYEGYDLAFCDYGPYWKLMRKVSMVELFTVKRTKESKTLRESQTLKLMESVVRDGCRGTVPVDVRHLLSALALNVVSLTTFGMVITDQFSDLVNVIDTMARLMGAFVVRDYFPFLWWLDPGGYVAKMKAAHLKLDQLLQQIIDEHRALSESKMITEKNRDFVDVMISLDEQEVNDQSIKAMIVDMLIAGTETSSLTIEWALSELLENPRCFARAQEELDSVVGRDRLVDESDIGSLPYLRNIVKETLRLHPPVPLLLPRRSTQQRMVNGYLIPKNSTLLVNTWSIGRDPSLWRSPEVFDPDRFVDSSIDVKGSNFELIPFGSGRRICPGLTLGMSMISITLARLIHGFEWRVGHGKLSMEEEAGMSVKRKVPLRAYANPRLAGHVYVTIS